jgi:hypothetical protein
MLFEMSAARFPAVTGEAVDGTPFAAGDLAGLRTIAFAGFGIEHRGEVESWVPFLDPLLRSRSDLRGRLFAVLSPKPKVVRAMLLAALRKAVRAPEQRASTIVLFTDVNAFCGALGIADRTHLAVFVLDEAGAVVWRAAGAYSAELGASLTDALAP